MTKAYGSNIETLSLEMQHSIRLFHCVTSEVTQQFKMFPLSASILLSGWTDMHMNMDW